MLQKVVIKNFRSILSQEVRFDRLNVLIGANGTGKSSLLHALRFVAAVGTGRLQRQCRKLQGIGSILSGPSSEPTPTFSLDFDDAGRQISYEVTLRPGAVDPGCFELVREHVTVDGRSLSQDLEPGVEETRLLSPRFIDGRDLDARMHRPLGWLRSQFASWRFHDLNLGQAAAIRHSSPLHGHPVLSDGGDNLATVLYYLQREYPDHYSQIRAVVRKTVPAFEDWIIETLQGDTDARAELWWRQRGNPRAVPGDVLSPGQLGVMAWAASLLHPKAPATLFVDEPELHLHPAALCLVGEIVRYRGAQAQVIVSTHSPSLVSQLRGSARFIQASWSESGSSYDIMAHDALDQWLREYTVGPLPSIPPVETRHEVLPSPAARPVRLSICYSHKDARLRREFEQCMSVLKREHRIEIWHDCKITPGSDWQSAIELALNQADIIVFLLSPNFLASDFCVDREMKRALERHQLGEVRVLPIVVRTCDWQETQLAQLKALPSDGRAVMGRRSRDDAWQDIVQGIRSLLAELGSDPALPAGQRSGSSAR